MVSGSNAVAVQKALRARLVAELQDAEAESLTHTQLQVRALSLSVRAPLRPGGRRASLLGVDTAFRVAARSKSPSWMRGWASTSSSAKKIRKARCVSVAQRIQSNGMPAPPAHSHIVLCGGLTCVQRCLKAAIEALRNDDCLCKYLSVLQEALNSVGILWATREDHQVRWAPRSRQRLPRPPLLPLRSRTEPRV